ncbi:MAG TPA: FHA domain-containing protein [Myxococcaceae bacterium]|nr:FHA domain-containing protein [Myxococcaceae bacterium]
MQSFLLSVLAQQYGRAAAADFAAVFPDPWLVWEAGNWAPAQPTTLSVTQQAEEFAAPAQGKGEALVFQLRPSPGKTEIAVGRAPPCEVVVNDGTLSKRHATLLRNDRAWSIRDEGSRNGSWVSEVIAAPGRPVPLASGCRVRLGTARLTFLDSTALHARLARR